MPKNTPRIYVSNPEYSKFSSSIKIELESHGWEIKYNDKNRLLSASEVYRLANDFDGLIAGTEDLTILVKRSKKLKIISKIGVGVDNIPLNLCKRKKIFVSYTPTAVTNSVAELTLGLILNLSRYVYLANINIRSGNWNRLVGKEIKEQIIGIIGWGRIGKRLTELLAPLNPKCILVNDVIDLSKQFPEEINIKQVELDYLLSKSDIITIHADLNQSSKKLLNNETLSKINKNSFLINVARGEIIDESALYEILLNNKISAAAIDVFTHEPYKGKLLDLKNVILTCHMGSFSSFARINMDRQSTEDIIRFFQNKQLKYPVPTSEYKKQ